MKEIVVCMGSSCFSRGNARNAETIQNFIQEHHLEDKVKVSGCLCESNCKSGPNIKIDGKLFTEMNPESLSVILEHELGNN